MRASLLIVGAAALLVALAPPALGQRGAVYCNITEIKAEQLSNGVRITIAADGALQGDWDTGRMIALGAFEVKRWSPGGGLWIEPTEKCTRLSLRFPNARSKLGSCFVPVGKYPVSHVELSIPDWAASNDGVGVYVDIVNYQGWATGEGQLRRYRYDVYSGPTEDGQGWNVAWLSDRFPPPPAPQTPQDLPTELTVRSSPRGISVKAVNAKLQEVTDAIASETGLRVTVACDSDVRVSCHLQNLPVEKALAAIAMGCGVCDLCLPDGTWRLATDVSTAGGYEAALTRRIPLHFLRARDAMDLLPNLLLPYLTVNDEANELAVTGPAWMGERVAADLAKLDLPPREVALDVTAVECTSTQALVRELRLDRFLDAWGAGFSTLTGDLSCLLLAGLPRGWEARLDHLDSSSAGRIRSRATLRVMSGHIGRVFAGQQRNLILEQIEGGYSVANLETVSIGTSLQLTPQLGSGPDMLLGLDLQLDNLSGADPSTGLPIISRRRAASHLQVRDGDTILIAGLQLADQTRAERGIPVLSKLPWIGGLFRAPYRARSQTQLAVFITPHLVKSQTAAKGDCRSG